ncbi:hypothetical protein A3K73_06760 [Candidatus Pacearchaeota archaeon RBG_13_36_9]|nr:MAG: hypothetical protein A3K73_06760 [Candidatus Pacearchaeota archaeon RBG_13_36_9]
MDITKLPSPLPKLRRMFHDSIMEDIQKAREEGAGRGYILGCTVCCIQYEVHQLTELASGENNAGLLETAIKDAVLILRDIMDFKRYLESMPDVRDGAYNNQMGELNTAISSYDRVVADIRQNQTAKQEGT